MGICITQTKTLAAGESVICDLVEIGGKGLSQIHDLLISAKMQDGGILVIGGAPTNEWIGPFGASGDTMVLVGETAVMAIISKGGWPVTPNSRCLMLKALRSSVEFKLTLEGEPSGECPHCEDVASIEVAEITFPVCPCPWCCCQQAECHIEIENVD